MSNLRRNKESEWWTVSMVMQELNVSRNTAVKIATQAGALVRLGKVQRINWDKLTNYIRTDCIQAI